jgi:hypothetical protein
VIVVIAMLPGLVGVISACLVGYGLATLVL